MEHLKACIPIAWPNTLTTLFKGKNQFKFITFFISLFVLVPFIVSGPTSDRFVVQSLQPGLAHSAATFAQPGQKQIG